MTGSTLSTLVTHRVVLGRAGYDSPLTITSTGAVMPTGAGANGVVAPSSLSYARLINEGMISGGTGRGSHDGGIGVDFHTAGKITNSGTMHGGNAGYGDHDVHGVGGIGVSLAAGDTLMNRGVIIGGNGFYGIFATEDAGGAGVLITGLAAITNTGSITGGVGGGYLSSEDATPGRGGASISRISMPGRGM